MQNDRYWTAMRRELLRQPSVADFNAARIGNPLIQPDGIYERLIEPRPGMLIRDARIILDNTRWRLAKLIGCNEARIALSYNTTQAIDTAVSMLALPRGSHIITTTQEYSSIPSVLREHARRYGLAITEVPIGPSLVEAITSACTPQTKLVLTSHITHLGEQLPVERISAMTKERGITYIVDAAQSIGHIPVDVHSLGADVVAGCGHKWLRSETATGFAYYAHTMTLPPQSRNTPFDTQHADFEDATQHLEYDGLGNTRSLAHLGANLATYERLGWEEMFKRTKELGDEVYERLRQNPRLEMSPRGSPGMITFYMRDKATSSVQKQLEKARIYVTHKEEEDILRVSASAFNTSNDIARLDRALLRIGSKQRYPPVASICASLRRRWHW